jgi:hypothetical protein
MTFKVPEKFRVLDHPNPAMCSNESFGNNGLFVISSAKFKGALSVIASDGAGWEHVSVSKIKRCPTWNEMCVVKDMFWGADDCVVQYHPPKSLYVNNHPHCLHLWRKVGSEFEIPSPWLVGIPGLKFI